MPKKTDRTVEFEIRDRIATVTLNRPGKRNALTLAMFEQLREAVHRVEGNGDLRVLVIRGEGGTFCAGDDLTELLSHDARSVRDFLIMVQGILTRLEALSVPVVAAVEGFALGGGLELALACDVILANENARLGLPESNLGIIPGLGGCIRLPRRVGVGRGKEMIFSGRTVEASEALTMGLVDRVFPSEAFEDGVNAFATGLTRKSAASLALAKSTILRGMDASLEAGLALEREAFAYCFALPDAEEGITAFLEKREPRFGED